MGIEKTDESGIKKEDKFDAEFPFDPEKLSDEVTNEKVVEIDNDIVFEPKQSKLESEIILTGDVSEFVSGYMLWKKYGIPSNFREEDEPYSNKLKNKDSGTGKDKLLFCSLPNDVPCVNNKDKLCDRKQSYCTLFGNKQCSIIKYVSDGWHIFKREKEKGLKTFKYQVLEGDASDLMVLDEQYHFSLNQNEHKGITAADEIQYYALGRYIHDNKIKSNNYLEWMIKYRNHFGRKQSKIEKCVGWYPVLNMINAYGYDNKTYLHLCREGDIGVGKIGELVKALENNNMEEVKNIINNPYLNPRLAKRMEESDKEKINFYVNKKSNAIMKKTIYNRYMGKIIRNSQDLFASEYLKFRKYKLSEYPLDKNNQNEIEEFENRTIDEFNEIMDPSLEILFNSKGLKDIIIERSKSDKWD